jgi:hypothetical protein
MQLNLEPQLLLGLAKVPVRMKMTSTHSSGGTRM